MAMEPEPEEDEEQAAAAAAATEAPDESAVLAARVKIAGHEVAANSTVLDVSEWGLTAAQVREVAGALPQLFYLQELVLDGVPVSGTTPRLGDFRRGVETLDANLDMFRVLCEALQALQGLTSLSLGWGEGSRGRWRKPLRILVHGKGLEGGDLERRSGGAEVGCASWCA